MRNLIRNLGIDASLKGRDYIITAVEILQGDMGYKHRLTGELGLYDIVGDIHSTTESRVERAIRHAIETAWYLGPLDTWEKLFPANVKAMKKPTNGRFLEELAEELEVKKAS